MPPNRQGADLVFNVEKPDKWQDPPEEVKARFYDISKNNPQLMETVIRLTKDEQAEWIDLLVRATFEIANKDWRNYDEVYEASILKCKETRVLHAKVWSEWGGARDVRAKLAEMYELSKAGGYLYVLPAPSLVATVVVKVLRNLQTRNNDDEASIRLDNLFQFDYLGFAIENYKPGSKYTATDVQYEIDPTARQPKPKTENQARKDRHEKKMQAKKRLLQKWAEQEQLDEEAMDEEAMDEEAKNQANVARRSSQRYDSRTGESVRTQSRPSSADDNIPDDSQMPTDNQPIYPPRKTVEVSIKRDEALAAVGNLIEGVSAAYISGREALKEALSEQLQQALTEQMAIVLPKEQKTQLAFWALIEQHNEISQWIRAAREDKTEHTWTEEVASQEDWMAALEETNQELMRSNRELMQKNKELKKRNQGLKKSRNEFAELVKESIQRNQVVENSVKGIVALTPIMKRKLDEAFSPKPSQSQVKREEDERA